MSVVTRSRYRTSVRAVWRTSLLALAVTASGVQAQDKAAAPAGKGPPPPAAQATTPSGSQPPAGTDPNATQLPAVDVNGRKNPLEESDRRRRELLEKSAPCIGCDAEKPDVPRSLPGQVLDTAVGAITPQSNKNLNHDDNQQREIDRSTQDLTHPSNSSLINKP